MKILSKVLFVIFYTIVLKTSAQLTVDYTPSDAHSSKSRTITKEIRKQLRNELKKRSIYGTSITIYEEKSKALLDLVNDGYFIKNDSLEIPLLNTFEKILDANRINKSYKTILISKDPQPNAFCLGEGSFIVTVGLLGEITNEGQLAFILAHELSHYELDHVNKSLKVNMKNNTEGKVNQGLKKVAKGKATEKSIENIKDALYLSKRYSRENELKADSMAILLLRSARFDYNQGVSMLSILDPGSPPQYLNAEELLKHFEFNNYPFQQSWLKKRVSIFSKKSANILVFESDSIESHPDYLLRINKIESMTASQSDSVSQFIDDTTQEFRYMTNICKFETVETAFSQKNLDLCLYWSLQLLEQYPHNSYLASMIGKVLLNLCDARDNHQFELYVNPFTSNYHEDLRVVNNFLYNLTREDIGELAFNFLNQKTIFNPEKEEHYFILWKICSITNRKEVQKQIKNRYFDKFGKGEYFSQMN